jgi:fatty-acyl-CoA synthase
MARQPGWADADLSSLRMLMCGGSPVPTPRSSTYQERGLAFLQGYGMTEASPGVLFLDAEHAGAEQGGLGRRAALLQRRRVVRPDLTDAAPGEKGEVVVAART